MNTARLPLPGSAPVAEVSGRARRLLLLATLPVLAVVGAAAALLGMSESRLDYELFGVLAGAALVLGLGLLAGWRAWYGWHRDSLAASAAVERLNRFHVVMSATNRLILRRPEPAALFAGVCEVLVSAGHTDLALVHLMDGGETQRALSVRVEAGSGRPPRSLQPSQDSARLQRFLLALALRSGEPVVIDDAMDDARLGSARAWCTEHGVNALAALPLMRGGAVIGILLLHSRTKAFYAGAVGPLLAEMADDLSFALDNSDRGRAMRNALEQTVRGEQANQAKNEFLSRMSHELRTPLNAVLGFAQLLATDTGGVLAPRQANWVRLISQAGWHLLGLVNDVMDLSHIEAGRFEVVNEDLDIGRVVDDAMALSQALAATLRVELVARDRSGPAFGARADSRRLRQVLINLLSNACKYNRPGGRVGVEVSAANGEVIVDVVDNGFGMTAEQLAHLFEPFNRLGHAGPAIEGTGIGLTLSRQLVEMMNGRLEIRSSPEGGTRARVALPSCDLPRHLAPGAGSDWNSDLQGDAATAAPALVLYIEDNPVNQIVVEQMLSRCAGIRMLHAANGAEGLALAALHLPDLVLLDMQLPDMSGFDVLEVLRADPATAALRVVALSASAMAPDIARAKGLGALDYWTKPLEMNAFLTGISALLGRRPGAVDSGAEPSRSARRAEACAQI